MVGERDLPRHLEHRVVVLADDLGADLRMALHPLPVGRRELVALAQDLGGHAELADVVQRRRDQHHLGHLFLRAGCLRDQLGVVAETQDAVTERRGLVHLHRAPQALDELGARALELLGALLHQALELLAPVDEREVQPHARLEHLRVDRLHDVVDRAELEALDLRLRLGLAGEEDGRNAGRRRLALERAAHLEARHLRHLDVEEDQIGLRLGERLLYAGAGIARRIDVVVGAEHLRHQRQQVAGVIDGENPRALGAHSGAL